MRYGARWKTEVAAGVAAGMEAGGWRQGWRRRWAKGRVRAWQVGRQD